MAKKLVRANFTQGLFEVQTTNFFFLFLFRVTQSRKTHRCAGSSFLNFLSTVPRARFAGDSHRCHQDRVVWGGGGGGFFTIRSTRPDHPSLSAGYPWGRMACLHLQCWQHHFPWPLPTASVISSDSLPTGFYGASSDFPQRRSAGFHLVTHELGRGD